MYAYTLLKKRNQLNTQIYARDARISRAIAFVPGIVVRNLLVVIAGPLLLNASFIALALRCVVVVIVCSAETWAKFHSAGCARNIVSFSRMGSHRELLE